jgi:hypothetical protein
MKTSKIKHMRNSGLSVRGFQDQLYKDSDLFFSKNEASVLDHIVPIFSIYYVDWNCMIGRSVLCTYVRVRLELTYHSLKTLQVFG